MVTGHFALSSYLLMIGSVTLFLIMLYLCKLQLVSHHLIIAAGAACLLIGDTLFVLYTPVYDLIGLCISFSLLTIFRVRLGMNRITLPPHAAAYDFSVMILL